MPPGTFVPVTPSVVKWAVEQSGFTPAALATALGVEPEVLRAWSTGQAQPKLGELRKLARHLDRPLATFLLPAPPPPSAMQVQFRSLSKSRRRKLYPIELKQLREAARLQRILSWINSELGASPVPIPHLRIQGNPIIAAADTRRRLGITSEMQAKWPSPSASLRAWRSALESSGVFVMMVSLGEDACRGFSLWDDYAPLVAANTAWSAEARVFTLFHEYAHLLTRTPSACVEGAWGRVTRHDDPAERWCERFAAAVILPPSEVETFLRDREGGSGPAGSNLDLVRETARHFRSSLRAAALSLIDMGVVPKNVYAFLPGIAGERNRGGGPPGTGRDRVQVRLDQYGGHTFETFSAGLRGDVVTQGDVLDYLDVPPEALSGWGEDVAPDVRRE